MYISKHHRQIKQNRSKTSDLINFASKKFLIYLLHSIISLCFCLAHHNLDLSIDKLTVHANEIFFGQNNLRSKGKIAISMLNTYL